MEANDSPLNDKQLAFCKAYTFSTTAGNGAASARAAGYSDKNASHTASALLKDLRIRAECERIRNEEGIEDPYFNLTRERLIQEIQDGLAHAKAEVKYKLGKTGKPIRDKNGDMMLTRSENAIKAYLELLAKVGGFMSENINIKHSSEEKLKNALDEARKRVYSEPDNIVPLNKEWN